MIRVNTGARAVTALGAISAMLWTTTPAHATSRQYPNCYYGESGRAHWHIPESFYGSIWVYAIYFDRSGNMFSGERVGVWADGPGRLNVNVVGYDRQAVYAVVLENDGFGTRGVGCSRETRDVYVGVATFREGLPAHTAFQSPRLGHPPVLTFEPEVPPAG